MSKAVAKQRPLTSQQRRVAVLDAQGMSIEEILKKEGIGNTTLARWRTRADYIVEREKWEGKLLEQLHGQLTRLKLRALNHAEAALEQAMEALGAEDAAGHPLWDVRREARRDLLTWPGVKGQLDATPAGALAGAAANAVVTVMFRPQDVGVVIDQEPNEVTDESG